MTPRVERLGRKAAETNPQVGVDVGQTVPVVEFLLRPRALGADSHQHHLPSHEMQAMQPVQIGGVVVENVLTEKHLYESKVELAVVSNVSGVDIERRRRDILVVTPHGWERKRRRPACLENRSRHLAIAHADRRHALIGGVEPSARSLARVCWRRPASARQRAKICSEVIHDRGHYALNP